MAKIDFSKVEAELAQRLQVMYISRVLRGTEPVSTRAILYYRLDEPRPKPRDPVEVELEQMEEEAIQAEKEQQRQEAELQELAQVAAGGGISPPPPTPPVATEEKWAQKETVQQPRPALPPLPQELPHPPLMRAEKALYILRQHLTWFKRRKVTGCYELLGTTKEEVMAWREKGALTPADGERLNALLAKAKEVRQKVLQDLGLADDEKLIEMQRKKHINKRFRVKESWLPLDTYNK